MSTSPLVSIIMVVYNSAEFLDEAITSVLNSRYNNLELIICDDCSTDHSLDIIKNKSDDRIRLFENKVNLGEYANRTKAINLAKGDYFIFVDGDDTLLNTNGLCDAVMLMEQYPEAGFGIVRPIDELGDSKYKLKTSKEILQNHFLNQSEINMSFARNIFRTAIVHKEFNGFPKGIISGDDFIRLSLTLQHNVVLLSEPFAKWRKRPGQATARKSKTIKGNLEPYMIHNHFLFLQHDLLSPKQFKFAKRRLIKKQLFHALLALKHLNFQLSKYLFMALKYYFGSEKGNGLTKYQDLIKENNG
ncbi:glycosyltransferase family 2 protein [Winogradskyella arenosi]|uniref:Glycosyltransferase involved in cell wall biosynthesis n=1 Tax=Winogradskyella arenosi TaxID=533325 RepID=A0A368ZBM3_9FLAO|nr:glycosyltransferase family 2 protein [Winogradskyella arenosi]RCW90258.1 glycosyltransferase involved in cell wall biosynthesis [Winogradskyella arenosi]